ncbi:MAG TPA: tyrosine-type recombinase/integrase [Pseudonocardiaceae bacterium]|jgi:integrase|nr:tyrosine-type recombinase/integrase [Pseudonocardiaceae bacterium]
MAGKKRRRFGWVRKLPSGRYQASYLGPDGRRRNAPGTFETKKSADQYLVRVENLIMSDEWTDPTRAKIKLGDYAQVWIAERPGLRPRTAALYRWLLRKHIEPHLGEAELGQLTTALVRQWRADRLKAGVSQSVTAKAYRLLRGILNTAVDEDKILTRNPCRVRGADREESEERPVITVAQVFALADRMPARFRSMVLLAAFASLRFGEVTALRRCDVAEDASWVRVTRAFVEVEAQGLIDGPPKSRAGIRTVIVPAAVRPEIVKHLAEYVKPEPEALIFTGEKGGALRRPNFNQRTKWTEIVTKLGLAGLHFHDLRHAGNIWASKAGMSTKDLMARMGHDDMRAALIYQRATSEADKQIADRLSEMVDRHRKGEVDDDENASDDGDEGGPAGIPAPAG